MSRPQKGFSRRGRKALFTKRSVASKQKICYDGKNTRTGGGCGLNAERIRELTENCPWSIEVFDEIDSTNSELKRRTDVPHGTVLVTERQTGGRGRLGRRFVSPPGGVYLSVLLRPQARPDELLHLTAMTAVAVRRAILAVSPLPVEIKWTNDLVCNGKKLCGILAELVGDAVVIGIGVNCNTPPEAFPPDVREIAGSLRSLGGKEIEPERLAAAMIRNLAEMDRVLLTRRREWLEEYARHCVTLGKTVRVMRGTEQRTATALHIDEYGALVVRYENGETAAVSSGEVSVRGMYGYYEGGTQV